MREIKFRAWYNDKELLEVDTIFFRDNELNVYLKRDNSVFGQGKCNVILEQYIGLHDKNDVKIYKGDIIKYDAIDCFIKCIIKWDGFQFNLYDIILKSFDKDIRELELNNYLDCEVIGNIHEGIKNA